MIAVILICGAILLGTASYVTIIAATGRRVQHQHNTVQCVYAAESGVQVALARLNAGEDLPDVLRGEVGGAYYETRAAVDGPGAIITSDGFQERPGRGMLARRIRVRCVKSPLGYSAASWETLPPPEVPEDIQPVPEKEDRR